MRKFNQSLINIRKTRFETEHFQRTPTCCQLLFNLHTLLIIHLLFQIVKQLTKHYQKSPEEITDEELRQYFLYNLNVREWSRVASTISLCGIKYFYTLTLKREWTRFKFIRPEKETYCPFKSAGSQSHSRSCRVPSPSRPSESHLFLGLKNRRRNTIKSF